MSIPTCSEEKSAPQCATVDTATMKQCAGTVVGRDEINLPACAAHCVKKIETQYDPGYGASERPWTVRVSGKTLLGKGGDRRRFKTAAAALAAGNKAVRS